MLKKGNPRLHYEYAGGFLSMDMEIATALQLCLKLRLVSNSTSQSSANASQISPAY